MTPLRSNPGPTVLSVAGFLYGALLAVIGFLTAGAGHGTYFFVYASSSPLWMLLYALDAVFRPSSQLWLLDALFVVLFFGGSPALWAAIGYALGRADQHRLRKFFVGAMVAHYVGWLPAVIFANEGSLRVFLQILRFWPPVVLLGILLYLGGQLFVWRLFIRLGEHLKSGASSPSGP